MPKIIVIRSCLECIKAAHKSCDMTINQVFYGTDYRRPIHPRCPLADKKEFPSEDEAKEFLEAWSKSMRWEYGQYRLTFAQLGFMKCFNWIKREK